MARTDLSSPILSSTEVGATYTSTDFTWTDRAEGGADISYTPSSPSDAAHTNLTVPGASFTFGITGATTVTLPDGPTVTTNGDALAVQLAPDVYDRLQAAFAPVGLIAPSWLVIEGAVPAEVEAALGVLIDAAEATARAETTTSTPVEDLIDEVMGSASSANIFDELTALGSAVASGTSRVVGLRAFYKGTTSGTPSFNELPIAETLANMPLHTSSTSSHGLVARAIEWFTNLTHINIYIEFRLWTAAAAGTSSKGTWAQLPVDTIIDCVEEGTDTILFKGKVMDTDGTILFDPDADNVYDTVAIPNSMLDGNTVFFRVNYSTSITPQYHSGSVTITDGQLSWGGTAGVWSTVHSKSTTGTLGKFTDLKHLKAVSIGTQAEKMVFYVGIPVFLKLEYFARRYAVDASGNERYESMGYWPFPPGVPVILWNGEPATDNDIATFYTDDDGEVHGLVLSGQDDLSSIYVTIKLSIRDDLNGLPEVGITVYNGEDEDTSTENWSAATIAEDNLLSQDDMLLYDLGGLSSVADGPWYAAVGTDSATLSVRLGVSGASYGSRSDNAASAIYALRTICDVHCWLQTLTSTHTSSWKDIYDERITDKGYTLRVMLFRKNQSTGTAEASSDAANVVFDAPTDDNPRIDMSIYYSSDLSYAWRRETVAHEICHIVLHAAMDAFGDNYTLYEQATLSYQGRWVPHSYSSPQVEPEFLAQQEGLPLLFSAAFGEDTNARTGVYRRSSGGVSTGGAYPLIRNSDVSLSRPLYNEWIFAPTSAAEASYDAGGYRYGVGIYGTTDNDHKKTYLWSIIADGAISNASDRRASLLGAKRIASVGRSLWFIFRNDYPSRYYVSGSSTPTGLPNYSIGFDYPYSSTESTSVGYFDASAPQFRVFDDGDASYRHKINWESAVVRSSGDLARARTLFQAIFWSPLLDMGVGTTESGGFSSYRVCEHWKCWDSTGATMVANETWSTGIATAEDEGPNDLPHPSMASMVLRIKDAYLSTLHADDQTRVKKWFDFMLIWKETDF